jgi:hypothetical protein
MKILASAACVLLLLGASASAQTLDDLKKDGNGGSTDNILTYGWAIISGATVRSKRSTSRPSSARRCGH